MATKVLAPHYLRLERDIARDESVVWRALTDLLELRAWWGMPVVELFPGIGGYFDIQYVGRNRIDRFIYTDWQVNWKVGGIWHYNWVDGRVNETTTIKAIDGGVRVSIEQGGFESFGTDTTRIFGYHKMETAGRLERLQTWCEKGVPANMAQMPAY
jgi:uncharacterized protein YndB with AHSA1/START domain